MHLKDIAPGAPLGDPDRQRARRNQRAARHGPGELGEHCFKIAPGAAA